MGETTNPRQIWAILAPLAAMAGLIFYMRRRRHPEESDTVKKAVNGVGETKIRKKKREMEVEPDSGTATMDSTPSMDEPKSVNLDQQTVKIGLTEASEKLEPKTPEVVTPEEQKVEEVQEEAVEEQIEEVIEEIIEAKVERIVEQKVEEKVEEPAQVEEIDKVEEVQKVEEVKTEEAEVIEEKVVEDQVETKNEEEADNPVELEFEYEKENEELKIEPLVTVVDSGVSGLLSTQRFRTESERRECEDWTNSPKPAVKETPQLSKVTNQSRAAKRDSAKKAKGGYGRRLADTKDERESTTTSPDSAKEQQNAKQEKTTTKKKTRPKKRSGRKSAKSPQGSATTTESSQGSAKPTSELAGESEITSSDSGTATDDQGAYLEIEGFPTNLIGALIGKSGSSIKKLQQDSKCKMVVKSSVYDPKQQTITIQGTGRNVRKALSMLKKRFPELNLGMAVDSSGNVHEVFDATQLEPEPYNYEDFFMGSVNNNSLQVELVEGIDVEVRVTVIGPSYPELWLQPYTHPSHAKFSRLEARFTLSLMKQAYNGKLSMNDFYATDKEKSILTSYPLMGDFAVCLHHAPDETSGQEVPGWYRVQIIQYPDDHSVVVMYVDFGGYATVPLEMVRKLMPEFYPTFSGINFQAVCATLDNVHPADVDKKNTEYITEAHVLLQDIISKAAPNSMRAHVHFFDQTTNTPRVTLKYENERGEEVDVNAILRAKFANWPSLV